jgi:hypothetical protein
MSTLRLFFVTFVAFVGPILACAVVATAMIAAEPVPVRYAEGLVHGFLTLRTLDGTPLATGDLIQAARGNRVTSRLIFEFRDGSRHEETAVFSQEGQFKLLTDHLVQRGPSFPQPLEMSIDAATGKIAVTYTDEKGRSRTDDEHMDLPTDLANGFIPVLLKNVRPESPPASVSFIAATPKPRLVKLAISNAGQERFSVGGSRRSATHYVLKVELGGLTGLLAPLVGQQPPDSHVWIVEGEAPAFVKSEQPLYTGGPVWRIELDKPTWRSDES